MNKGDIIAKVATPIAAALRMDCVDPATKQLRPESNCAKMRDNLNSGMSFAEAVFDRFWPNRKQRKITIMQFIVSENISQPFSIEADDAEAAIKIRQSGGGAVLPNRTHSYSVQLRPQPSQPRTIVPGQQNITAAQSRDK